MDNEPEVIQQQMEQTRASLAEKLETLENKVVNTVQEATDAVTDTVTTVKDTVQGTVESVKDTVESTVSSVKETFNLTRQVQRHPTAMVLGSMGVGFLIGRFVAPPLKMGTSSHLSGDASRPRSHGPAAAEDGLRGYPPPNAERATEGRHFVPEPDGGGKGWFSIVEEKFAPEINQAKELAIGAFFGLVRDLLRKNIPPSVAPQVTHLVDQVTTKLGGKPITGGSVLPEGSAARSGATSPSFGPT